jgi:hypothetical protein
MFVRDDIRAIVCARGGYGSNYLPLELDGKQIVSSSQNSGGLQRHHDAALLHGGLGELRNLSRSDGGQGFRALRRCRSGVLAERAGREFESGRSARAAGAKPLLERGSRRNPLWRVPFDAGRFARHAARNSNRGNDSVHRRRAAKPFQIDRMLMQLKLAGKLKGRARHRLRRNDGLPPESEIRITRWKK